MEKVLVIGGLGFVGSHVSNLLVEKGYEVSVLSRSRNGVNRIEPNNIDKINLIIKDLRDIKSTDVNGFGYIINLASSVDNYAIQDNEPYRDIENNCTATLALLEAIRINNENDDKFNKLLFVSTFFIYGNVRKLPANENITPNPLSLYGATRLTGENFCKIYSNTFGINHNVARLSNIFGPKESRLDKKKAAMNYMIRTASLGGEITKYDDGAPIYRDYLFVEDAANALVTIMKKGIVNEIYNIATGKPQSLDEMFNTILKVANKGTLKSISIPKFHASVGIRDFWADVSKLKLLGWEPKISFKEGVKATIEYYDNL